MLAPQRIKWGKTADIVVIGCGFAGAVAAIAANDLGATVTILEKQAAESHISFSSLSSGAIVCGIDADKSTEYMMGLCRSPEGAYWTDPDIVRAWGKYVSENKEWLIKLGAPIRFFGKAVEIKMPGSDGIETWRFPGRGLGMMRFMYKQLAARGIEIKYSTRAERLLTDRSGRVIGVRTDAGNVRALKAVIICTGGFEDNEEMKLQYLRMSPVYFTGGTVSTGDGILMAQDAGAALWHMNCVSARLVAKFPEYPIAFPLKFSDKGNKASQQISGKSKIGYIFVNKYGRRYINENIKSHGAFYELTRFDTHKIEYPAVPSYYIFDKRRMEFGPLGRATGGMCGPHQLYKWSRDNSAELARGWIISGETVNELARKAEIPPENLENTVAAWNSLCEQGADPEYGRNPLDLVPLDSLPYYGVKLYPGGPNTQGGPARNSKSQVLGAFGEPIPGLYAAGECGSVYGMLYPTAGGNLAECVAFGRDRGGERG